MSVITGLITGFVKRKMSKAQGVGAFNHFTTSGQEPTQPSTHRAIKLVIIRLEFFLFET